MKEFKITEEQIKENKDLTLKEYFKEVFETKLEVGKWYKSKKSIALVFVNKLQECIGVIGYGFKGDGEWTYEWLYKPGNEFTKATEEEVFNALKKESEKRGFVKGNKVKDNGLEFSCKQNEILKDNTFEFDLEDNGLWIKVGKNNFNCLIFENGKWAEIISQPEEIIELNRFKYKRID